MKSVFCTLAFLCLSLLVYPQDSLSDSTRQLAVRTLARALEQYYVFEDKGREMNAMLLSQLEAGKYRKYDQAQDLADKLNQDLQEIYPDKHLQVYQGISALDVYGESPDEAYYFNQDKKLNFGFREVKILAGNVGYLALDEFSPWAEAEATVVASMRFLERADALIIDLRENNGGAPEMVQYLGSHFLSKSEKTGFSNLHFRFDDKTLTFPNLKRVKGPRLYETPLFILISSRTGSAAESLAYDLQKLGRATIVGDTSLGGANPAKVFTLAGGLKALIAIGEAVNPITDTNWEGTGVIPDIPTEASVAKDSAYLKALEQVLNGSDAPFSTYVQELIEKEKLAALQARIDPAFLEKYLGKYGDREISMREEKLYYVNHSKSEQAFRILIMEDGTFIFDAQQTPLANRPRLAFKEEAGEVKGYKLIYPSGNSVYIAKNP